MLAVDNKRAIMKFNQRLQQLFAPLQNCEATALYLCKILNVPVTKTSIQVQLEEHPDYPSLLAVSDILMGYGVDNISIKTEAANLYALPEPMIAQVSIKREKYFAIILKVTEEVVTYYHPTSNKQVTDRLDDFSKMFTGFVLMAEVTEKAGEKAEG